MKITLQEGGQTVDLKTTININLYWNEYGQ